MSNAHFVIPNTHSYLLNIAKPKAGLTISFSTDDSSPQTVQSTTPAVVHHLSKLTTEASAPLEIAGILTSDTTITFKTTPVQGDSDVDLETGETSIPMQPSPEPSKLIYKTNPSTFNYKFFARTITSKEAPLRDKEKTQHHADLYYESYFQDFQRITDLRQKGQAWIQSFTSGSPARSPN